MPAVAARQLTTMTLGFVLSNLGAGAAALLTSVIVARGFGAEAFGLWVLASAWAATLCAFADLGFGTLIIRDAAASPAQAGALVGAAVGARLVLLAPMSLAFVSAAPTLGFGSDRTLLVIAAIALAVASAIYGSVAAAFRARPAPLFVSVSIEGAAGVVLLGGAVAIVETAGSIEQVLVLAAALQGAQAVLALALWSRAAALPGRVEWPGWSRAFEAVLRAWPFAASGLVATAQTRMAPLALGFLAGPLGVAVFSAAWRVVSAVRLLPHAALGGALPVLASNAKGGRSPDHDTAGRFERALATFAMGCAIVLTVGAAPILAIYGTTFSGGRTVLVWLAIGLVPSLTNAGRRVALNATGHEQTALAWSAVAFAIQVVCGAAWIPFYGAAGAAAALTAGEAAVWWPLRRTRVRMPQLSSPHRA
jgi:O-antigen/teichoic acid export membrane protein